jgi:hypothetical protein
MFGITWLTTEPHENPSFESTLEIEHIEAIGRRGPHRGCRGALDLTVTRCALSHAIRRCPSFTKPASKEGVR